MKGFAVVLIGLVLYSFLAYVLAIRAERIIDEYESYLTAPKEMLEEHRKYIRTKRALNKICLKPKEVGNCKAYFPRFYFDTEINECTDFIYGGCGGNENNFELIEDCEKTCKT